MMFKVLSYLIVVGALLPLFTVQAVRIVNLIPSKIITVTDFGINSSNEIEYVKNTFGGVTTMRLGPNCFMNTQDWEMLNVEVVTVILDGQDYKIDRLTDKTEITIAVGLENAILIERKGGNDEI